MSEKQAYNWDTFLGGYVTRFEDQTTSPPTLENARARLTRDLTDLWGEHMTDALTGEEIAAAASALAAYLID